MFTARYRLGVHVQFALRISRFLKFRVTHRHTQTHTYTHTHTQTISLFISCSSTYSYTTDIRTSGFKARTVQLIRFQLLQESLPRNESRRKFLLPVQTALCKVVLENLTVTQLVKNFPASKELQGSHSVRKPDISRCAAHLHSAHNLTHSSRKILLTVYPISHIGVYRYGTGCGPE